MGDVLKYGSDGDLALGAGIAWGGVGFDIVNAFPGRADKLAYLAFDKV
jgi:hypothetical protein